MNFLKKIFSYIVAIAILAVLTVFLKTMWREYQQEVLIVFGAVLVVSGLWGTLWPKAFMRRYEKTQLGKKRWREKHPTYSAAWEDVVGNAEQALGETLAQRAYRRVRWTRLSGMLGCLLGSLLILVGLFG